MTDGWIEPPAVVPLSGDEPFRGVDGSVRDFWAYAMSDLRMNNTRGYLAEFLVAKAVGATGLRIEWDAFDVLSPDGIRIEVKTAGYMQSWRQARPSRIGFVVKKARTWTPEDGESAEKSLNADVYVFALQGAPDHAAYDVLDVDQWSFFVLSRVALEASGVETFSLGRLEQLGVAPVAYGGLGEAIRHAASGSSSRAASKPAGAMTIPRQGPEE